MDWSLLFGTPSDCSYGIYKNLRTKGFNSSSEEEISIIVDQLTFSIRATQSLCASLFWSTPDKSLRKWIWGLSSFISLCAGDDYHFDFILFNYNAGKKSYNRLRVFRSRFDLKTSKFSRLVVYYSAWLSAGESTIYCALRLFFPRYWLESNPGTQYVIVVVVSFITVLSWQTEAQLSHYTKKQPNGSGDGRIAYCRNHSWLQKMLPTIFPRWSKLHVGRKKWSKLKIMLSFEILISGRFRFYNVWSGNDGFGFFCNSFFLYLHGFSKVQVQRYLFRTGGRWAQKGPGWGLEF